MPPPGSADASMRQPLRGNGDAGRDVERGLEDADRNNPERTVATGRLSEPERVQVNIHNTSTDSEKSKTELKKENLMVGQSFVGEAADVPAGEGDDMQGLTTQQADQIRQREGKNEIPEQVEPWYVMLGKQFVGMMPMMLIIAAALSGAMEDWTDFAVIAAMLIVNALIGFHEEYKARQSLDALKSQMTASVPTMRDGTMVITPVADLVPGDVIFLRGGNVVPADCELLEGDEMLVDTAALTGEPIPRKVKSRVELRQDPAYRADEEAEKVNLLSGCIVKQGEGHCKVKKTGLKTEIGQAAGLVAQASGHQAGIFETKIMQVVRAVIILALVDAIAVLYVKVAYRKNKFSDSLLSVLALVIGAVPIALPLVMQVTMAIGASFMAKKKAIVTHLTALQEIASMTVLCSDKTGTLTKAEMNVNPDAIWTQGGGQDAKVEALTWACVASNPANKEDPIDKAILASGYETLGGQEKAEEIISMYKKDKFIGFNPTVKRTVVYCTHPKQGKLKISKGLLDKVLSTGDDGGDCWECKNATELGVELKEKDFALSTTGYKTVGVAVGKGDGQNVQMEFKAIIPMMDPPRDDTRLTIYRIREAGINVKMITGDHLNIAVETSRRIGLGTAILPATELWPASATRDETILSADGFAQVLPKDKREVILVLQNRGLVVGMTGDGVNDAPALAQAQIGIAVHDATEAARSAADIILTSAGLSAIFDAVAESRKIFARLRSYVLYRIAATIQIVLVLSILIYAYNDTMPTIYVILLALVNDVSMLPVANDNAVASALPEIPSMPSILLASFLYGFIETGMTMTLYATDWLSGDGKPEYRMAVTYLQISIAVELLIFSCRTPGFVLNVFKPINRPSVLLFLSVMMGNILVSLLAGFGVLVHQVSWRDIGMIWAYDVAGLVVLDLLKVFLGALGADWMSAGSAGGVLTYAELPYADADGQPGQASHRSTLMQSRASARSVLHQSRLNSVTSNLGSLSWSIGGAAGAASRSGSTLPYPYNLRAAALRNLNSF
eukprot:TRINITY_DN74932_c0_g1_i1.p1 TRINITY_DN74932_c0_g1~~TRINITY_DN74932_c0_g1_i1.p1  ORF type:complete len:1017 (+),score=226.88 TRINITY_DN74932_c0_g1_i1:54-3104(+)